MIQKMVNKFATVIARREEWAHPSAVILSDFPRVIQFDRYSCGAKSLYAILRFYRKRCTIASVEEILETDEDGTSVSDIKKGCETIWINLQNSTQARNSGSEGSYRSGTSCADIDL